MCASYLDTTSTKPSRYMDMPTNNRHTLMNKLKPVEYIKACKHLYIRPVESYAKQIYESLLKAM